MTSSNGNIFRVTGPLCGEFTGPGEFPAQRSVTRSFDVFFDLRLNKRLRKQSWGWWLWRHCNVFVFRYVWIPFIHSSRGGEIFRNIKSAVVYDSPTTISTVIHIRHWTTVAVLCGVGVLKLMGTHEASARLWFRLWLAVCLAPSCYLNQYWLINDCANMTHYDKTLM